MRRAWLFGLVGSVLALAALLASVGPVLGRELIGIPHFDAYGTAWFYWYTERVLEGHASAVHTDLFFFPWGKDIYGDTGANLLDAVAAVPFRQLLGATLGFNSFVVAGFLAQGVATGWAARALARDPFAVATAGVLGVMAPFAWTELTDGRPTQGLLLVVALAVGVVLRLPARRGFGLPLLGGLALALCGLQYWYYGVFGGLFVVAHGVVATAVRRDRGVALRHLLMAGSSLVLVLPFALPMLLSVGEGGVAGVIDTSGWGLLKQHYQTMDGETVALYLWQPLMGAAGALHQHDSGLEIFLANARYTAVEVALLSLVGAVALGRRRWAPLAAGMAIALVAIGPVLLVGTWLLPNPVYVALAKGLSIFARLWWPARAYAFLAVLFPVLAAAGVAASPRFRPALGLFLLLGTARHLHGRDLLPLPHWEPRVPAASHCLAHGPEGAIIALPDAFAQEELLSQTVHGRPTLGGMNDRLAPPESKALQRDNAFVAELLLATDGRRPRPVDLDEDARQALVDLGFRYVTMTWPGLLDAQARRRDPKALEIGVRHVLTDGLGEPVWSDPHTTIWDLQGGDSPCAGLDIAPETAPLPFPGEAAQQLVDPAHMHRYLRRLGDPAPRAAGPGHRPDVTDRPKGPPGRPRGR